MNTAELHAAIGQLNTLAWKLGVVVEGCGCCGSAWVRERNVKDANGVFWPPGTEIELDVVLGEYEDIKL